MNKTLEAIKKGQVVATEELFELVNVYEMTRLSVTDNGDTIVSMQVNLCESYQDTFKFTQECACGINQYTIRKDDIISSNVALNEEANVMMINCVMKDGKELQLMILYPNESFKETLDNDYHEIDVYDIKEFLDDVIHEKNEWYIVLANIMDVFGFNLKMNNPFRTYINTLDDNWKLHIGDNTSVFEVPVHDDSDTLIYMKETNNSREIIVKTYGHPFMDIKMLFFKRKNQE